MYGAKKKEHSKALKTSVERIQQASLLHRQTNGQFPPIGGGNIADVSHCGIIGVSSFTCKFFGLDFY